MENVRLSRGYLYELVWTDPLTTLAKKYNISDNGLRKACFRMKIPLPKVGHWSKMKVGKASPRPTLLPDDSVEQSIILPLRVDGQQGDEVDVTPQKILQSAIEHDQTLNLVVPTTLIEPDHLILKAQKALAQKSEYYREGDLVSSNLHGLDVRVAPGSVERALCLMDTFLKAMRQRGHGFKTDERGCYLIIGHENIQMTLKEGQSRVVVREPYERTDYRPSGVFALRFESHFTSTTAKDGKVKLEEQLSKIIARVELYGEKLRIETIERERRRRAFEEEKRIKEAQAAKKRNEVHGFVKLLEDSRRWKQAETLRHYIEQVERKAISEGALNEEVRDWLLWARKKADWFDPLVDGHDEFLKDLDKSSLLSENIAKDNSRTFSNEYSPSKPTWPLPWYKKV